MEGARLSGFGAADASQVRAEAAHLGVAVERADRPTLDRMSAGGHHQGVAARTRPFAYADIDAVGADDCILHVAPESFVGGPLAFVQTGDEIEIDVDKRSIHLHVSDAELARRKAAWTPPPPKYPRGYGALYSEHIGQADQGCDFDFLSAHGKIPEPEIH